MTSRSFATRLLALAFSVGLFAAPADADRNDDEREERLERRLEHRTQGGGDRPQVREERIARLRAWLAGWLEREREPHRSGPPLLVGTGGTGGGQDGRPTRAPVSAVPEPGSALVFGAGLIVAGAASRRRRRRAQALGHH